MKDLKHTQNQTDPRRREHAALKRNVLRAACKREKGSPAVRLEGIA